MSGWPSEPRYDLIDLIEGEHRTVLDVGCWHGYTMAELAVQGHEPYGIDIEDCRKVGNDLPFAKRNLEVMDKWPGFCSDGSTIAITPMAFHYMLLGDVLEHLANSKPLLKYAREILSPNGRIIVSVPNLGWIGAVLPLLRGESLRADAGVFDRTHLRVYNAQTLKDEVEAAGFNVIEIGYRHFKGTEPFPPEGERHVFQYENLAIDCDRAMYDALNAYQILLVAEVK